MKLSSRLSLFVFTMIAVVLVGFSSTLYLLAHRHLYRQLDERLEATLDTLEAAVDVEPSGMEWEPQDRRINVGLESGQEDVRWSIQSGEGVWVDSSLNAADGSFGGQWRPDVWPVDPPDATVFADSAEWRLGARRLRLADLLRLGRGHSEDDGVENDIEYPELIVIAGVSPLPVQANLRQLAGSLVMLSVIVLGLAAGVGQWLSRRALSPLIHMTAVARAMPTADRGARLPATGTKDELEELQVSFNGLLDRLHVMIDQQERFAGDASHQLRTPLTGLLSLTDVIQKRERSVEEYCAAFGQVREQTMRMRQIVESLLFLARADAQAVPPQTSDIDLAEWVPQQKSRWADHPRSADLQFAVQDESPTWIRAHPSLLAQLLDNLLDNACKYSEAGTPITVGLWTGEQRAEMIVEDQGLGIAAEEQIHVFESFYRSAQVRQRNRPGLGLGLAIAKRIANTLDGRIKLESRLGRGTRFVVSFPLHATPLKERAAQQADLAR